jgi:hypothetical protein
MDGVMNSGHEVILVASPYKDSTKPNLYYSIYLDAIKRNREVGVFNTFFCGNRKANWNKKTGMLYTFRYPPEFEIEKKSLKRSLPDWTEHDTVTPLASLYAFFDLIGYDLKNRKYKN